MFQLAALDQSIPKIPKGLLRGAVPRDEVLSQSSLSAPAKLLSEAHET